MGFRDDGDRLAALLGTECGSRKTCGRGYGPGTAGLGPEEQSAGPEKIAITPTDVQPRINIRPQLYSCLRRDGNSLD